jgi:hypothetical protein
MNAASENIKKKYDVIGWGLLFVFLGVLNYIPGDRWNIFFIGLGAIILAKNLVLFCVYKVPLEWFMVIIGAVVLLVGFINEFNKMGFPLQLHFLDIVIIVVGVALLIRGIFSSRTKM